jgi:hypothetical protein
MNITLMHTIGELCGFAGGTLGTVVAVPQVMRIRRLGHSDGVSLLPYLLLRRLVWALGRIRSHNAIGHADCSGWPRRDSRYAPIGLDIGQVVCPRLKECQLSLNQEVAREVSTSWWVSIGGWWAHSMLIDQVAQILKSLHPLCGIKNELVSSLPSRTV